MGRKWTLLAIVLALSLIVLDFFGFCQRTAKTKPPNTPTADAIIVLTGGSGLRIAAALQLIEAGHAPTALISGVNPDITVEELARRAGGAPETYACCVEFGYTAQTTVGNAEESAEWAIGNSYETIIVVTSDYHMPRSLLLLGNTMPNIEMIPYPVRTRINPAAPFDDARSFRGLVAEWLKWRVTNLRLG